MRKRKQSNLLSRVQNGSEYLQVTEFDTEFAGFACRRGGDLPEWAIQHLYYCHWQCLECQETVYGWKMTDAPRLVCRECQKRKERVSLADRHKNGNGEQLETQDDLPKRPEHGSA